VKGFVLSMIETAIEVTDGRVPASVIAELMAAGVRCSTIRSSLLPHARETVEALADRYRVVLITKGDLLHQERKLAQSGWAICSTRSRSSATRPRGLCPHLRRHGAGPEQALMVGNSLRSDVIPPIIAGGWGVHVPHGEPWALEHAEAPACACPVPATARSGQAVRPRRLDRRRLTWQAGRDRRCRNPRLAKLWRESPEKKGFLPGDLVVACRLSRGDPGGIDQGREGRIRAKP
jgi:hypothetical protein